MTGATAPDSGTGRPRSSWLATDDRLARRGAKGDKRAFEAIFERYHQDLYRFCLAMLGNPQDAQDALQNTMVKVLRALPGERRRIQLKPWLYRIARNEAIETMRGRRDSVEIDAEHAASPSNLEIAETVEARERLRRLIADLAELPERQRSALVMRELAGLNFDQIGAAFATSAAVARQTIYEARRSLRQMEAGREMSCDQVMRELSDADGRVTRRRELRAHVRSCPNCRLFQDEIARRRGDLAAIAPLPLAASAGLLHGILTGKASAALGTGAGAGTGAGGGMAGTLGAGAGKAVATSALVKSAATVVVVAAVGVSAADRSGLIHVPIPGVQNSVEKTASGKGGAGARHAGSPNRASSSRGEEAGPSGNNPGDGSSGSRTDENGSSAGGRSQGSRPKHGRAHSRVHHRHHGMPAELPPSSEHGQQTAAAHKPASHPTHPSRSPSAESEPAPSPTPPTREHHEPTPETVVPTEPSEGKGSSAGNSAGQHMTEAQELEP